MSWWAIMLIVFGSLIIGLPVIGFIIMWIVIGIISVVAICKD